MTPTPPPPRTFGDALAYAVQSAWNDSQPRYRFSTMWCRRAGREYMEPAFHCEAVVRDRRTGEVRRFRGVILADGTPTHTSL